LTEFNCYLNVFREETTPGKIAASV